MKKLLKRIFIGVGAVLLLLIIAVGVLLVVIDPNDYRDEISEAAYQATGRKIELGGPLELKILPRLAISAQNVKLAAAEGFGTEPLLSLNELSLRMAILPLLKGSVQIDTVVLDGLKVALVTDKNGKNNWDVPAAESSATASEAATETPVQGEAGNVPSEPEAPLTPEEAEKRINAILSSRITAIIISKCSVSLINQQAGQDYYLYLESLSLSDVGLDRDITAHLNVLAEDRKAAMKAKLVLDGTLKYMLREQEVFFDLKKVTLNGEVPQLDGSQSLTGAFSGNFSLASMSGKLDAALKHAHAGLDLKTDFALEPAIKAGGNISLNASPAGLMRMLKMEGELTNAAPLASFAAKTEFDFSGNTIDAGGLELVLGQNKDIVLRAPVLNAVLDDSGKLATPLSKLNIHLVAQAAPAALTQMAGVATTGKQTLSKLAANVTVALNGNNLKVSDFTAEIDKDTLALSIPAFSTKLTTGAALPVADLSTTVSLKAKPRVLMDVFGIEMQTTDPNVLRDFSASLALDLKNYELKLNNLKAKLDDTTLAGMADIKLPGSKNMQSGRLATVSSNIQLGTINLDRYLAPKTEAKAEAEPKAEPDKPATSASAQKQKGPLQDSALEKVYADITLGMQKLTVSEIDIEKVHLQVLMDKGVVTLKKGQLRAFDGQLNATARAALAQSVPDFKIAADVDKLNLGKALVALADEKRLDATGLVDLDIAFKGMDTDTILQSLTGKGKLLFKNGSVRNLFSLPTGVAAGDLSKYSKTNYDFRDIDASFTFIDGKLVNDHVNIHAGVTELIGVGSIILASGELDYKGTIHGPNGEEIPVLAGGPVKKLWVKLDTDEAAKIAARKAAEKAKEELNEKYKLDEKKKKAEEDAARKKAELDAKAAAKKAELEAKAAKEKAELEAKAAKEKERAKEKVNDKIQQGIGKLLNKD
ncbi:AsmA family protein [Desulfovibrio sp. OttesenSCG-928-F07]|nr:AsmA family protein [Desulfovibrio sp. OttesenSCG-928-F07]